MQKKSRPGTKRVFRPGSELFDILPKTPGLSTADHVLSRILNRECIDSKRPAGVTVSDLHKASIFLFRHILPKGDQRWRLALQHARLHRARIFRPLNLENALLAKYASGHPGGRTRYSSVVSKENITQLARALTNIESGNNLIHKKLEPQMEIDDKYNLLFERTKSITRTRDPRGVTGCPEALWQLQLYAGKRYLARIGFNFHLEGGKRIVSVSNVQGAASVGGKFNAKKELETAKTSLKEPFGSYLIKRLKTVLGNGKIIYRGILPANLPEEREVLYRMSFRKAKIPIYN